MGAGGFHQLHGKFRQVDRQRHCIVHEASGKQLPAFVPDRLLEQRRPDPLGQSTLDLTDNHHRVDHSATVVHRDESVQRYRAGILIDPHHRQRRSEGVGVAGGLPKSADFKPSLHAIRRRLRPVGHAGHFRPSHAAVLDVFAEKYAVLEFHVLGVCVQQARG